MVFLYFHDSSCSSSIFRIRFKCNNYSIYCRWGCTFEVHERIFLFWFRCTFCRLSSMLHFCVKVFSVLSIIFLLILNIFGYIFFSHYSLANTDVDWSSPWILLTLITSLLIQSWDFRKVWKELMKLRRFYHTNNSLRS